jgi:hypothetical protein
MNTSLKDKAAPGSVTQFQASEIGLPKRPDFSARRFLSESMPLHIVSALIKSR